MVEEVRETGSRPGGQHHGSVPDTGGGDSLYVWGALLEPEVFPCIPASLSPPLASPTAACLTWIAWCLGASAGPALGSMSVVIYLAGF